MRELISSYTSDVGHGSDLTSIVMCSIIRIFIHSMLIMYN